MSIYVADLRLPYISNPQSVIVRNYDTLFSKFRVLRTILGFDNVVHKFHGQYKSKSRSSYDFRIVMTTYYDICVLALNKWVLHKLKSHDPHIDVSTVKQHVERIINSYAEGTFDIILHKSLRYISKLVFHSSFYSPGIKMNNVVSDFEITQNICHLFHDAEYQHPSDATVNTMLTRTNNEAFEQHLDQKYGTFSLATYIADYILLCKTMGIKCSNFIDLFDTTFRFIHEYIDLYDSCIFKSGPVKYNIRVIKSGNKYEFNIMYRNDAKVCMKLARTRHDRHSDDTLLCYFGIDINDSILDGPRSESLPYIQERFTEMLTRMLEQRNLTTSPKKIDVQFLKTVEGRDFKYTCMSAIYGRYKDNEPFPSNSISSQLLRKYGVLIHNIESKASNEYEHINIPPDGMNILVRCIQYLLEYREILMLTTAENEYLPHIIRDFGTFVPDISKIVAVDIPHCLIMAGWHGYRLIDALYMNYTMIERTKSLLNFIIRFITKNRKALIELNRLLSIDTVFEKMFLNDDVFVTTHFVDTIKKHMFADMYSTGFESGLHPFKRKFYRWPLQKFRIRKFSLFTRSLMHGLYNTLDNMLHTLACTSEDLLYHPLDNDQYADKFRILISQYEASFDAEDPMTEDILYIRMYNPHEDENAYRDDDDDDDDDN